MERNGSNRATNDRRHYRAVACCSEHPRRIRAAPPANPTASQTIRLLGPSQARVERALDGPMDCRRFCRIAVVQQPKRSIQMHICSVKLSILCMCSQTWQRFLFQKRHLPLARNMLLQC